MTTASRILYPPHVEMFSAGSAFSYTWKSRVQLENTPVLHAGADFQHVQHYTHTNASLTSMASPHLACIQRKVRVTLVTSYIHVIPTSSPTSLHPYQDGLRTSSLYTEMGEKGKSIFFCEKKKSIMFFNLLLVIARATLWNCLKWSVGSVGRTWYEPHQHHDFCSQAAHCKKNTAHVCIENLL